MTLLKSVPATNHAVLSAIETTTIALHTTYTDVFYPLNTISIGFHNRNFKSDNCHVQCSLTFKLLF